MARRRRWTRGKRRRARRKAEAALKERRRVVQDTRGRPDTKYAGLVPVVEYAKQLLRLPERLEEKLDMRKGRTATFTPVDEAMGILGCQMAGILRLNHIDQLLPESVLADVLGLPRWPSENTEQRFLKRATGQTLEGLDSLMRKFVEDEEVQRGSGPIEVDGDVTGVPQRARKREGVQSGYCGGRVRPCYQQPRVTVNGLPWWTDLRPGADGCMDVFDRTLETAVSMARRHPRREVFMRMDSYFVSMGHIRMVQCYARDHRNLIYLMPAHEPDMKAGRWEELVGEASGRWKRVSSTTQILELGWVLPWGERTDRIRAVAVRRGGRAGKGGRGKSAHAGEEKRYLILTNATRRRLGTRRVFDRYHQRQREEFSFKDGKQSLSTAKMPTLTMMGNRAHVKMVALAQVILHLFTRRFLPHKGAYGPTCKTIREKVIAVGGKNQRRSDHLAGAHVLRVPLVEALVP
jgi:hypothetical protein